MGTSVGVLVPMLVAVGAAVAVAAETADDVAALDAAALDAAPPAADALGPHADKPSPTPRQSTETPEILTIRAKCPEFIVSPYCRYESNATKDGE
jgi:hypothetical protein